MKVQSLVLLVWLCGFAAANLALFNEINEVICSGIYSKEDWGGSFKPSIDLKLTEYDGKKLKKDGKEDDVSADVAFLIFEYKDYVHLGVETSNGMEFICKDSLIESGICSESERGMFIVSTKANDTSIYSSKLTKLGSSDLDYEISQTGYYCLYTYSSKKKYKGYVNFQNAFGYLNASEIPKLPAYGILTLCYAIALALFGFQFFKKRKENQILPLQKYLLAMLGFLTFDTFVVWSYYDLVNRTKNPTSQFVIFYMVFLALLNSVKITFGLFLLLCVSLGYGVVVVKLPKKVMLRCKILAGFQFLTSFFFLFTSYYTDNSTVSSVDLDGTDLNGLLGIIPFFAIAVTSAIYYISITTTIFRTIGNLNQQRQIIKLQLYKNLMRVIAGSMILMIGGLLLSSVIYLSMSNTEMFEKHWKSAFFIYDFWPSVVFFGTFICISWLWRPTETSYMLAISQQLSTDDSADDGNATVHGYHQGHEFELDDLSLISHSDTEQNQPREDSFELSRDDSSPATKGSKPPPQYEELDGASGSRKNKSHDNGNTLFELGEDDESDEDKADDRITH